MLSIIKQVRYRHHQGQWESIIEADSGYFSDSGAKGILTGLDDDLTDSAVSGDLTDSTVSGDLTDSAVSGDLTDSADSEASTGRSN